MVWGACGSQCGGEVPRSWCARCKLRCAARARDGSCSTCCSRTVSESAGASVSRPDSQPQAAPFFSGRVARTSRLGLPSSCLEQGLHVCRCGLWIRWPNKGDRNTQARRFSPAVVHNISNCRAFMQYLLPLAKHYSTQACRCSSSPAALTAGQAAQRPAGGARGQAGTGSPQNPLPRRLSGWGP